MTQRGVEYVHKLNEHLGHYTVDWGLRSTVLRECCSSFRNRVTGVYEVSLSHLADAGSPGRNTRLVEVYSKE